MTGLPQGWETISLEELGMARTSSIDPSLFPNERFELFSVPSYSNLAPELPLGSEIGSTKQTVEPGDVMVCKIVPHINRVWVVPPRGEFRQIASSEWIVIRNAETEPKFLRWLMSAPDFRNEFLKDLSGIGGSLTRARPQTVAKIEIPLPPLPEQRRIVRRLDTLSARSTTARTHLTAIEKLVERYKLAVLSGSLFRNGTPVKRLGEVLTDIRYGTAAKCSYDPSGTPVLRIPNIQSGRIDRTDLKSAHFATKEIEQLALKAGDILVIRSNGSPDLVGRVALVTDGETDCLFAGYLIRLRLSATEALPEYVRLCFESDEVRAIIEAASKSTSGVNNVNSTQLKEIALPMPTVDEQREIVRRIETAFGKIDRLAAEAAKALKLLGHLDQRILAKAFAGDLVPQDPTDEPAETLLARIREARATAPTRKRGRKAKA